MKAEDLMIGDWVQIVPDAPVMPNEYHRIDWIRTGEIGLDNRKIVTYPYIQPIPLTPEILEKNGMILISYGGDFFPEDKHYVLELSVDEGRIFWTINGHEYDIMCLRFVHQLQHALRLCGIEKEIEL